MARGGPHRRGRQDGGVEPDHVVAQLDHRTPPGVLHVAQHVDPERPVVVGRAEAAVDLGRGEDEAPVPAQADDLFHQVVLALGASGPPWDSAVISADYRSVILVVTSLASSRPRTVSTARPSSLVDQAVQLLDVREGAPGDAAGRAQHERELLEGPLLRREHLAPGLGAAARARWRRCSDRGCARSTSAPRRDGCGRPSRCPRSRPGPSRAGCGGTGAREGPVGDLLPAVPGAGEDLVGHLVAAGQTCRRRDGGRPSAPGACRLDRQGVGADVRGRVGQGEHRGQRALASPRRSPRPRRRSGRGSRCRTRRGARPPPGVPRRRARGGGPAPPARGRWWTAGRRRHGSPRRRGRRRDARRRRPRGCTRPSPPRSGVRGWRRESGRGWRGPGATGCRLRRRRCWRRGGRRPAPGALQLGRRRRRRSAP